jgi:hypothetical protein
VYQTWEVLFDIFYVIQVPREWVLNINNDHFPIDFALLQQGYDAKNLDLLNLSDIPYPFANFADVERVIVTLGLGLSVSLCWVFPGLPKRSQR